MKKKELATVQEFQDTFGFPSRPQGTCLKDIPEHEAKLRKKLIVQELQETLSDGVVPDNIVQIADGYGDVVYVLAGTYLQLGRVYNAGRAPAAIKLLTQAIAAVDAAFNKMDANDIDLALAQAEIIIKGVAASYEVPMDEILAEVHRSNMSKKNADGSITRDSDGKVIKPETYSPADIQSVLQRLAAA